MNFSLYINNGLGDAAYDRLSAISQVILNFAKTLSERGFSFESNDFQQQIIQECKGELYTQFPTVQFEFFFMFSRERVYMIVNNLVDHQTLITPYGQYLYDIFSTRYSIH